MPAALCSTSDGDQQLNQDDTDDDGDGYADTAEAHVGTVSPGAVRHRRLAGRPERAWYEREPGGRPGRDELSGAGATAGDEMRQRCRERRWDLVPGKGLFSTDINVADLVSVITTAPSWNGGVRAFNGPPCPGRRKGLRAYPPRPGRLET